MGSIGRCVGNQQAAYKIFQVGKESPRDQQKSTYSMTLGSFGQSLRLGKTAVKNSGSTRRSMAIVAFHELRENLANG